MMRETLERLSREDNLRRLPEIDIDGKYIVHEGHRYLNFSSNDYLGLSHSGLHRQFMEECASSAEFLLSNPSSRLITGNSPDYGRLEEALGSLYGGRSVLVAGSGYLVNAGILPAVTGKGDLILADKLVHASLIDGLRLCEAEWRRFNHNDTEHLERLLQKFRDKYRNVWIVTESIFSMDGDVAPLRRLSELKSRYGLKIYVDEAHAFGACGPQGLGIAEQEGVGDACDIRIATFGKAIASQGAFAVTDPVTREYLVNRMRTLIFSTALPPISLRWSEYIVRRLGTPEFEQRRQRLRRYASLIAGDDSRTHILPLTAGENSRAIEMSRRFREAGFWVMPIRYPTVPKGTARIRVSLDAGIDEKDILNFASVCKNIG